MDIVRALQDRDIKLAAPASSEALAILRAVVSPEIFSLLHDNIYRHFDGFADDDFDAESFLRIWPIEAIASSELLTATFVPFMDVALHSDVYGLADEYGPTIFSRFMDARTTVSIEGLVDGIVRGEFDDSMGLPTDSRKSIPSYWVTIVGLLGAIIWTVSAWSGFSTAAVLWRAGLRDFGSVVAPFLMPLVGLSLSTFFSWWLLRRGFAALALALASFSLFAAALVLIVGGGARSG